jgi:hypothetical protein
MRYIERFAADKPFERAGPDLGVCGEEERLEVGKLGRTRGNAEEPYMWIEDRAGRSAIAAEELYVGVITLRPYLVWN